MAMIVANWKMYQPYDKAIAFIKDNLEELEQLIRLPNELIIAPSFVCLAPMHQMLKGTGVKLCAQDCASINKGPFTGEVDALSLAQVGCSYAIVGHSERRELFGETDEQVAAKVEQLIKNNITPIICIGETLEDYQEGHTLEALAAQLDNVIVALAHNQKSYCVAYEPSWAIGSGKIPSKEELTNTFELIWSELKDKNATLLYGGSVNEKNVAQILKTPHVGGLLIGSASCDFQTLKKIVSLTQIDY